MRDLENRQTNRGTALRDEVVVVVFSEMGRAPYFNFSEEEIIGPSLLPCCWGLVSEETSQLVH